MKRWIAAWMLWLPLAGCGPSGLPEGKLYLSNVLNGTVTVLDASSGKVLKKLEVGGLPHNFAPSADQRRLFLTNTGTQSVSVIDTWTDTVDETVWVAPPPADARHAGVRAGGASCRTCHHNPVGVLPAGIAREPVGDRIVVANAQGPTLTAIDPATLEVVETASVVQPEQPILSNLTYHPTRDELYVVSRPELKGVGRLTVMDRRFRVKRSLEVIKQPWGMALSPDGDELYIASRGTNKVQVWDTRRWKLLRTLTTGNGPVAIYMSPQGKLYTANYYTSRPSYMSVLDPHTGRTLKRIETTADLTMLTTDPSRRYMYLVNCGGNKLQVIDTAQDAIVAEMPGGAYPLDVAFVPKRASGLQP